MIGALTQGVINSGAVNTEIPDTESDNSLSNRHDDADDDVILDELETYMLLASSAENTSMELGSDDDEWDYDLEGYEFDLQQEAERDDGWGVHTTIFAPIAHNNQDDDGWVVHTPFIACLHFRFRVCKEGLDQHIVSIIMTFYNTYDDGWGSTSEHPELCPLPSRM
eukprot:SAG11_NODE_7515_length_1135_cov_4.419884_2_plen_165_part_01